MAKIKPNKDPGERWKDVLLKCRYCDSELTFPDYVSIAMHVQMQHPGERMKADWVEQ